MVQRVILSCREQALLTARHEPVFTRERVYERIKYPNVYDSYAEATKTPAFVGGSRVSLFFLPLFTSAYTVSTHEQTYRFYHNTQGLETFNVLIDPH